MDRGRRVLEGELTAEDAYTEIAANYTLDNAKRVSDVSNSRPNPAPRNDKTP
jgi:hypothetical protein